MAALSNFLENAILNATLRNVPYTSPGTVWIALYTSNPTVADSGTEVVGGGYARVAISFAAPSGGVVSNSNVVTITNMPAVTISYLAIRDASTAGNLLYFGPLATAKTLNSGDAFIAQVGDISVALT